MTAFGLVVALSWKDAINALVVRIIPSGSARSLLGHFITATAVTLLVVALATAVLQINRRLEKQREKMSNQIDQITDLFARDQRSCLGGGGPAQDRGNPGCRIKDPSSRHDPADQKPLQHDGTCLVGWPHPPGLQRGPQGRGARLKP